MHLVLGTFTDRVTYTTGGSRLRPNVVNVRTWTRSCMPFSTARKQIISLNKLNRLKKKNGDNFKINVYLIVFGSTHKIGNNASKLGIFLWSRIIKTIWICRKLLEEGKPCKEMEIKKKTFVKQRIEMEHFVASGNDGKRENFLNYWCYESILATCTDAFSYIFVYKLVTVNRIVNC